MLKPACFLCFWHLSPELTHEESPKQIKDAVIMVAMLEHTFIFDRGCEPCAEWSVRKPRA